MKAWNDIKVRNRAYEGLPGVSPGPPRGVAAAAAVSSRAFQISKKYFANFASDRGSELIQIRSRLVIKCGEVNSPTLRDVLYDMRYCWRIELT